MVLQDLQSKFRAAGFSSLRDRPELKDFEPRYEPLVIKSAVGTAQDRTTAAADTSKEGLQRLLQEDWEARRPTSKAQPSVLDFHKAYLNGKLTPTAVAKALLPLIKRDGKEPNKHSVAFLQVREDLVVKAAEDSTKRYQAGTPLSVLDGVPVAVKDEVDLAGYRKCYGSKMDFTSKHEITSWGIQKWIDAGALVMGKTTMHELGADTTGNNPNFGTPLNPNNENYYTGGSSSGSAYAVAAGLVPLCEGNDGGGSIRIPSNYCGLYGLKTSRGRVSVAPSTDLAKSNGVAGPIAANMVDLEIGYRIMAQPNRLDPDSALFVQPESVSNSATRSKVLGIYRPWFDQADPFVRNACQKTVDHLVSKRGYKTVDITIPLLHEGQLAHALTILSELVAGVNASDDSKLTPANKVLLGVARKTTSVDFLQAQRLRNLLLQHLSHLYSTHPGLIIVTPTTPNAGWRIEKGDLAYGVTNGNKQIRNMEYVWLANFTGCPAITSPVAYADPEPATVASGDMGKIPVGLQGMAEWCAEDDLIAFGYDCEAYLHEEVAGGRLRPGNWTDVLGLAAA